MFDYDYDMNKILHDLGIEESAKEFQTQVLLKVDKLVEERMLTYVQSELTDEQMSEFIEITDHQAAQEYLEQAIPDVEDRYRDELGAIVNDLKLALNA